MVDRFPTLLDILSSQQFRTVILLALGLDTCQIAELFETSEQTVCSCLCQCFDRAGCRSVERLAHRLLYECENDLYGERLEKEIAELQSTARRMLEKVASPNEPGKFVKNRELSSATWVM
jgi:hypothetical protein